MSILSDAWKHRVVIEQAVQSLDDTTALTAVPLYPEWSIGINYTVGFKVQRSNKLFRCLTAHTSHDGWQPENAHSLWEQINETHSGELNDPIPYDGNMALVSGLHYIQNGVIYVCNRDTVNPVYNALSELVGLYVEEI